MRRLLIGLALALIALPAWAHTRNANMKRCLSEDDPDVTIAGCNALIQSGHETAADLAIVYNKRGIAYVLKAVPQGPYDQAIADLPKRSRLDPITPMPTTLAPSPITGRARTSKACPIPRRSWRWHRRTLNSSRHGRGFTRSSVNATRPSPTIVQY